eukprot:TRINITY_DN898_c0_g1_i16.p1 TRINITY_DN898_c0_g1~~TRINITY_DN898_c0_g1_i16.p1  ORF type:complete len:247 (+),score=31.53 TRINITY_DN898_c0_g1_i16:177-917(+)
MELKAIYKTKEAMRPQSDSEKNWFHHHHNSRGADVGSGDVQETHVGRSLLKRKSFPYDVFSPNFSSLRKALPPTLKSTKKHLHLVTHREKAMQGTHSEINEEPKNSKAEEFLPSINPLVLLKYHSVKNLSANHYLPHRSWLSLISRNDIVPPYQSENTNLNHPFHMIPTNLKTYRLKPLTKKVIAEDKIKESAKYSSAKSEFAVQKLNLLKGAKRLSYSKGKAQKKEVLDKIEEDSESIVNVTFGK